MRRLIREAPTQDLSGTLILVPMANPPAARVHMQSFPYPDPAGSRGLNDLNRRWFRSPPESNPADRIVSALKPVVALADAVMDLHCHEYLYPPIAWANLKHAGTRALALALGFEVHTT
jgi:predicted deacylase